MLVPRYYGDQGWYGHHDGETGSAGGLTNLRDVETDIYLWALQPGDLERLPKRGWIGYLTSGDAAYPLSALQQGLAKSSAPRPGFVPTRALPIFRRILLVALGLIRLRPRR